MLESLPSFVVLLLGFGFLIFVHELGHFLAAKWVGIKVTQFAIGFGTPILAWRKGIGVRLRSTEPEYEKRLDDGTDPDSMGETEYRFNWLPLGGYVKMLGQDDLDPDAASDDPRSFTAKPFWARACVISAGVAMNLIFGVILFIVCFLEGVAFPPNLVGGVIPGRPAALAYAEGHDADPKYLGMRPGDVITRIDDEPIEDFIAIKMAAGLAHRKQVLKLTIRREGESDPLVYRVTPTLDEIENLMSIGIVPAKSLEVGWSAKGSTMPSALSRAGVVPGMRLTAVDGQPVAHFHQFEKMVTQRKGHRVTVTFRNPEPGAPAVQMQMRAVPQLFFTKDHRHLLGMIPAVKLRHVLEGSPAETAGAEDGDILVKLGKENWPDIDTVIELAKESREPLDFTVLREGEQRVLKPITPNRRGKLGFEIGGLDSPIVAQWIPGSPAEALSLSRGSRILAINDQAVLDYHDMQRILAQIGQNASDDNATEGLEHSGNVEDGLTTMTITYQLNMAGDPIETKQITIDRETAEQLAMANWLAPSHAHAFGLLEILVVADGPVGAILLGIEKTHMFMVQTYLTLLRMIEGTVKPNNIRGPVGIAQIGTLIARDKGWTYFLFFLGLISVNLVVINFLPIPIVDGGLMVFLIIEKLKGSPVSVRVQSAATIVGLALIISLFVTVTWFDVSRWVAGS